MEIQAHKETLNEDLAHAIDQLQRWKAADKKKTNFVIVYGATVSAITTVLIGLASYVDAWATQFQIMALLTSGSLTVVGAWDGLFQHKKLWVLEATTLNQFYELSNDIRHMDSSGVLTQERVNECYLRYKSIYSTLNRDWASLRDVG